MIHCNCKTKVFTGLLMAAIVTACAPEKDRQIYDDGAKYFYKVTKTDSTGKAFENTYVMKVKGGFFQEGLFDQIPVEWYQPGQEDLVTEAYVQDNANGVSMQIPYAIAEWDLAPVIPHPQVPKPLGRVDSWSMTKKGHLSHKGIDSTKHRFQIKGQGDCQVAIKDRNECWHIAGKNLSQQAAYGEWVIEAWFHPEMGFVKWIYDKLGADFTLTFELTEVEGLKERDGDGV